MLVLARPWDIGMTSLVTSRVQILRLFTDFNRPDLRKVLPELHQHARCAPIGASSTQTSRCALGPDHYHIWDRLSLLSVSLGSGLSPHPELLESGLVLLEQLQNSFGST